MMNQLRLRSCTIFALLLLMPLGVAAKTTKKKGIPVHWYQPTIQPSNKPDYVIINLPGRTRSNIPIVIEISKAYTVKSNVKNKKWNQKLKDLTFKSNGKGFFDLKIEVPIGLLQIPILFSKYLDTKGEPILLTVDTTDSQIKLNVDIRERPKPKVQTPPAFETIYEAGGALTYISHDQSIAGDLGIGSVDSNSTGIVGIYAQLSVIQEMWQFRSSFKYAPMEADDQINGLPVRDAESDLMQFRADGFYVLNPAARTFWLLGGIDYLSQPLLTLDAFSEYHIVSFGSLRARVGFWYEYIDSSWSFAASGSYLHPFYLSVDSGELEYNPKYTFQFEGQFMLNAGTQFRYGPVFSYEMINYDYDFRDSGSGTINQGTNDVSILEVQINGVYTF